jgi:hypothetical protein
MSMITITISDDDSVQKVNLIRAGYSVVWQGGGEICMGLARK